MFPFDDVIMDESLMYLSVNAMALLYKMVLYRNTLQQDSTVAQGAPFINMV